MSEWLANGLIYLGRLMLMVIGVAVFATVVLSFAEIIILGEDTLWQSTGREWLVCLILGALLVWAESKTGKNILGDD